MSYDWLKQIPKLDFSYPLPAVDLVNLDLPDKSAAGLLEALDTMVDSWQKALPADAQPVILAIVGRGVAIEVHAFSEVGYHGIGVQGRLLSDGTDCLVIVHQSNLQLLCRIEKIADPKKRSPIGFRYSSPADEPHTHPRRPRKPSGARRTSRVAE